MSAALPVCECETPRGCESARSQNCVGCERGEAGIAALGAPSSPCNHAARCDGALPRATRLGAPASLLVLAISGLLACSGGLEYGSGNYGGGGGGGVTAGVVDIGTGIQFVSSHNGSTNPAVDTITAGSAMTWTWSGALPHSVRSTGTPTFTSSGVHTGTGTYAATFTTPGTYKYDCSVHGAAMTGTVVVLPAPAADARTDDVTGVRK